MYTLVTGVPIFSSKFKGQGYINPDL